MWGVSIPQIGDFSNAGSRRQEAVGSLQWAVGSLLLFAQCPMLFTGNRFLWGERNG